MQTNIQRFFEERNGIKVNPILETLRTIRFLLIFTTIIWLVFFIFVSLLSVWASPHSGYLNLPLYTFLVVLNIFNLAINIAQGRYWKKIEQRRFAIIRGDRTMLATEQPRLDIASIKLPLTIKLRYTKEFVLFLIGAAALLACFFAGVLTLSGPWLFPSHALLFFLVIFVLVLALFIVIIVLIVVFILGHQQIEVKEKRITARYGGKVATVEWEEARLFAMYNTFGAQKSGAAITYELSSARDIVRWTWVRHKTFFVSLEPTLPLDEYNRQMQELLALVEAKTGLALYDLRH